MSRSRWSRTILSLVSLVIALQMRGDEFGAGCLPQHSMSPAPDAATAFAQKATREVPLEPAEPAPPATMAPQGKQQLRPRADFRANDLSLEGAISAYQVSPTTINMTADRVANNRNSGTSSTLRLYVYATPSVPVFGSTINGYVLGFYQFTSTLAAGSYFANVDRTVAYTAPPNGTYYVSVVLSELASGGLYQYHDFITFTGTTTFGPASNPTPVMGDHTMTEDVDASTYQPTRRTSTFSTTGKQATSWVLFNSFVGTHTLQWRFFNPDGSVYGTSDLFTQTGVTGLYYSFWFSLSIAGNPPATRPGTWKATFFLDGNALVTETFNITTPTPTCTASASTACLNNNRFAVSVTFKTPDGKPGTGQAIKYTEDTALFWFFSAGNIEMVLKVLNACGLNSRYWVYGAASTDVEYTITVRDSKTGTVKTYAHPPGTPAPAITDGNAFATCP